MLSPTLQACIASTWHQLNIALEEYVWEDFARTLILTGSSAVLRRVMINYLASNERLPYPQQWGAFTLAKLPKKIPWLTLGCCCSCSYLLYLSINAPIIYQTVKTGWKQHKKISHFEIWSLASVHWNDCLSQRVRIKQTERGRKMLVNAM